MSGGTRPQVFLFVQHALLTTELSLQSQHFCTPCSAWPPIRWTTPQCNNKRGHMTAVKKKIKHFCTWMLNAVAILLYMEFINWYVLFDPKRNWHWKLYAITWEDLCTMNMFFVTILFCMLHYPYIFLKSCPIL